jgi:hypothetical protein
MSKDSDAGVNYFLKCLRIRTLACYTCMQVESYVAFGRKGSGKRVSASFSVEVIARSTTTGSKTH